MSTENELAQVACTMELRDTEKMKASLTLGYKEQNEMMVPVRQMSEGVHFYSVYFLNVLKQVPEQLICSLDQ